MMYKHKMYVYIHTCTCILYTNIYVYCTQIYITSLCKWVTSKQAFGSVTATNLYTKKTLDGKNSQNVYSLLSVLCTITIQLSFENFFHREHAKAHLRTSLGCALTLKNHLGQVHWIIANGLGLAARTELGVEHVLRRLLKQFYYCTAEINAGVCVCVHVCVHVCVCVYMSI